MNVIFAGSVHCAHNKRVEADAVKRRAVSCCLGGRAAHAQRYTKKRKYQKHPPSDSRDRNRQTTKLTMSSIKTLLPGFFTYFMSTSS